MSTDDANFWFLSIIGVDCAHQRQGIVAALMKHALQQIDGLGGSAYLACSHPRNLSPYRRHGFIGASKTSSPLNG
jgi:predicted N-acetyltransferase YhbS